jgi:hypothetical protein
MDLPGFHVDGSAIVALLALFNTIVLVYSTRKTIATHDAVNGLQAAKIDSAHALGVVQGVRLADPPANGGTL